MDPPQNQLGTILNPTTGTVPTEGSDNEPLLNKDNDIQEGEKDDYIYTHPSNEITEDLEKMIKKGSVADEKSEKTIINSSMANSKLTNHISGTKNYSPIVESRFFKFIYPEKMSKKQ